MPLFIELGGGKVSCNGTYSVESKFMNHIHEADPSLGTFILLGHQKKVIRLGIDRRRS